MDNISIVKYYIYTTYVSLGLSYREVLFFLILIPFHYLLVDNFIFKIILNSVFWVGRDPFVYEIMPNIKIIYGLVTIIPIKNPISLF